jgi:hypothetical protein
MATLQDKNIQDTYFGLIKTEDNCLLTNLPSGRINLTDGHGNSSSISIGKQSDAAGIEVCGPLISTGAGNIGGTLDVSSNINTTGKICANGCIDTDENVVASKGIFANCISIGKESYGCNISCAYESIQLRDNNNLRIYFGGTQTALLRNSGDLCVAGEFTSGGTICTNTNINASSNITAGGCINATGSIRAGGDVIAYYSSDKRLKDNVKELSNNNLIHNIKGYEFDWNEKSEREGKNYGFIAQEVKEILPDMVKENSNGYLAIDYIQFIPLLLEEIKDLNKRVQELENN